MKILHCTSTELEKALPNTSEDYFNRSSVTFVTDNGEEKTLHVLYVRFYDEQFSEFVPYEANPLAVQGERAVYFRDIVALVALIRQPALQARKRLYLSEKYELQQLFANIDKAQLDQCLQYVLQQQSFKAPTALALFASEAS